VTMRVGLREANQQFSRLIRAVRAGHEVILTDRNRPIAILTPLARRPGEDAALRGLASLGLLRQAKVTAPMRPFRPRRMRGAPLSATLREQRDAR